MNGEGTKSEQPADRTKLTVEIVTIIILHALAVYFLGLKTWLGIWCLLCAHRIQQRDYAPKP